MDEPRLYELRKGDVFSVGLETLMTNSVLLYAPFQILKFDRYKRKWWQIWKPKWTYYAQIKFLG